jgi:hypothetical protein
VGSALQSPPETPSRLAELRAAFQRRVPRRMRLALGLLLLFGVAFLLAILPLFMLKGTLRAEIAGMQSSTGVLEQPTTIDLGIDNVGDRAISPVCLSATFDAPVDVQQVVFQGLDRVPFRDGRACGGQLSGQQTISATMTFVPHQAGTMHVFLVASQADKEIGPVVSRTVEVSPR